MEFLSEYQQYFDQENDENFLDFSLDFKYKSHKFDWSQENQNQTYGTQNQGYGMGVKENGQESVKLQNMLILSLKSHITTSDTIPLGLNHHFNNHTTSTNKNQQELLEIHNQSNEQDHYQFDHLVPIKLELDITDTLKLRDSFLWNLYELYLTPEKVLLPVASCTRPFYIIIFDTIIFYTSSIDLKPITIPALYQSNSYYSLLKF